MIPNDFVCPKREEPGIVIPKHLRYMGDCWLPNRWTIGEVVWNWAWTPRACSFCGATHPDDVLDLLDEGWYSYDTKLPQYAMMMPPGLDWLPDPTVMVYRGHFNSVYKYRYENALVNSAVSAICRNTKKLLRLK